MRHLIFLTLLAMAVAAQGLQAAEPVPLIVAHRGASGTLPEHTLPAYGLAIEQGADFVEPDVVATKDGVLICRHECELGATTDVAEKFPGRKRTCTIDGVEVEGWFPADFTLAEIKTLRARQAFPFRDTQYDGKYEIPTLEEMIRFVQGKSRRVGRSVGIIPEIKHSTYHDQLGLSLEEPLLKLLEQYGYRDADDPCVIQSFEVANLKELAGKTKLRLVQLMEDPKRQPADVLASGGSLTYAQMMTPDGLHNVARYAWAIGPWKETILPRDGNNRLGSPTSLIGDAHAAGLKVVPYTFRNEPRFLAAEYDNDPRAELQRWFDLDIDGLFTDFPETAVSVRQAAAE